jgi:hypothetical protein
MHRSPPSGTWRECQRGLLPAHRVGGDGLRIFRDYEAGQDIRYYKAFLIMQRCVFDGLREPSEGFLDVFRPCGYGSEHDSDSRWKDNHAERV